MKCSDCKLNKPLSSFYNRYKRCKACVSKYNVEYLRKNRTKLLNDFRAYNATDKGKARLTRMKRKYEAKYKARSIVYYAVKTGELLKPNACEECNRTVFVNAHHTDYKQPLDVNWLCRACHNKLHRKYA